MGPVFSLPSRLYSLFYLTPLLFFGNFKTTDPNVKKVNGKRETVDGNQPYALSRTQYAVSKRLENSV